MSRRANAEIAKGPNPQSGAYLRPLLRETAPFAADGCLAAKHLQVVDADDLVQAAGAEALQVERDVFEAEVA